jgi:hypothetical protein
MQPQQSSNAADSNTTSIGNQWCHADLSSTDDTSMVFDYQVGNVYGPDIGSEVIAGNVWLNVTGPDFQPSDSPAAVVIVYTYPGPCGSPCGLPTGIASNDTYPLSFQNGRFTASLPNLPIFDSPPDTDGSDSTGYYWELAVTDNGNWYKDPSTGNNLAVSLREQPGYCAAGTTF